MDEISDLRAFLETQPRGPILETSRLVQLLSSCWDKFAGSADTSMGREKLRRIEEPEWHPPILSFSIERHGQTVMGSKRATLCDWSVDLENRILTASWDKTARLWDAGTGKTIAVLGGHTGPVWRARGGGRERPLPRKRGEGAQSCFQLHNLRLYPSADYVFFS